MSLKIIKTALNVIDSQLAYNINKDLKENTCSENAETALVWSIYKKVGGVKSKTIDQSVF